MKLLLRGSLTKVVQVFAMLLATMLSCQAEVLQFRFEFRGFLSDLEPHWNPSITFSGYFAGEDRNGDLALERSELLAFTMGSFDVYNDCTGACTFSYFRYSALEVVKFSYHTSINTGSEWTVHAIQNLNPAEPFSSSSWGEGVSSNIYATSQTTYSITSVVPEPSAALMVTVGAALTGIALRRRRIPSD
ncbi:PEP-CTERM sorting domain-containing protein [Pseudoduganella buxea]|nr:PEP-CTERM sorting domain-containing protein [Pseudoduganella buxea]GGC11583.1 hypothetical protein GCM10011572_36240 [Pseudoduganella buxea]